jgi:hypothetical protein
LNSINTDLKFKPETQKYKIAKEIKAEKEK